MELAAKKKYSHRNNNNHREIKTIECKKNLDGRHIEEKYL
jgi:hypothetical protein